MESFIPFKILKFFLENPYEEIYLRQLSKKLKLSPFVVKKYLDIYLKQGFLREERRANLRYFQANLNNLVLKHLKITYNISLIVSSGLVEFLKKEIVNLSAIVLFGSMAKGEDDKSSDVDILIVGNDKNLSFEKFEEKIGKKINEHTFLWSKWNKEAEKNRAFYFDIISYGISLYGELPIVK